MNIVKYQGTEAMCSLVRGGGGGGGGGLVISDHFKYWAEKYRSLCRSLRCYIGVSYNTVRLSRVEYYNHHTRR